MNFRYCDECDEKEHMSITTRHHERVRFMPKKGAEEEINYVEVFYA